MTDQTKAPERIHGIINALRNGYQADMDGIFVKVSRQACEEAADLLERNADLAAEQVREAREAILDAIASIPHPDDLGEAEGLEKAYRAAEVAADMPEGSVRSIKEAVREAYERGLDDAARVAEVKPRKGGRPLSGPHHAGIRRGRAEAARLIRALKSDDASDAHGSAVSSECNTPSPGRAASSVAPAAWQPIETAPRDGAWIIVCVVENGTAYRPSVGTWDFERKAWSDGLNCGEWPVTHWMPLPPPPQESAND